MLFSVPGWAFVFFAVFAVAVFAATVLIKRRPEPVMLWSMLSVLAACAVYAAFMYGEYYPTVRLAGKDMQIEARITDDPQEKNGKYYYPLRLISLNGENKRAKLILSCDDPVNADVGDRLSFCGDVYVRGADNDDLEDYYRSTGVYLKAHTFTEINVTAAKHRNIVYYPALFRRTVRENIMSAMPGDRGGMIIAMLFGDTSFLSDHVKGIFRNVGLSHLFSVSGLHISIWAVAVAELLRRIGFRGKASHWLSIIFALLFMTVTGYSYSCVRAGIMIIIMLIGEILDAPYDPYNSLGAAVLISTLIRPFSASSVSLQLSALSALGIIFVSERMSGFNKTVLSKFKGRVVRPVAAFFIGTVEAAFASVSFTLPVTSAYFGKITLVSPVSNLVMLTVSSAVMTLGGIAGILSLTKFTAFLAVPPVFILKFLSGISLKLINWLDGYRTLFITANGAEFKICLAGIFILIAAYLLILRKTKIRVRTLAAACAVVIAVTAATSQILDSDNTKIIVLDVGNGSAVLVTKGERSLLLGCGGGYGSENKIINALGLYCKNGLDVMIVPDETDTESGASVPVVRNVSVREVIAPELSVNKDIVSAYSDLNMTDCAGITLWKGMNCEYLYDEDNCCAYLNAEGTTALIMFKPVCDTDKLPSEWLTADILICRKRLPENIDIGSFKLVAVSSDIADVGGERTKNIAVTAGTGDIVINSAGNSVFNISRK